VEGLDGRKISKGKRGSWLPSLHLWSAKEARLGTRWNPKGDQLPKVPVEKVHGSTDVLAANRGGGPGETPRTGPLSREVEGKEKRKNGPIGGVGNEKVEGENAPKNDGFPPGAVKNSSTYSGSGNPVKGGKRKGKTVTKKCGPSENPRGNSKESSKGGKVWREVGKAAGMNN